MNKFIPQINSRVKKEFKRKSGNYEYSANSLVFGYYGIKAIESGLFTSQHFNMLQQFILRNIKKTCKFWFRIFPQYQLTRKPTEVRMGGGKGKNSFWVSEVKKGRVILEVNNTISKEVIKKLLNQCLYKLPFKGKVIYYKI